MANVSCFARRVAAMPASRSFTLWTFPGGLPEPLPLPMAYEGSYSPDRLAYVPFTNFRESWQFQRGLKHYRGGTASADLDREACGLLGRKSSSHQFERFCANVGRR